MIKAGIIGGAGYTAGELIRILLNHKYVDLRVHYEDESTKEYKPTKKGIAVNPKILPEVVEMMVRAAKEIS